MKLYRVKKFIFFILVLVAFIFFENCSFSDLSKKYVNENEINNVIDKYPIIGFFYLNKIEIKKGFLSIREKNSNYPIFLISGEIEYSNFIKIICGTQIATKILEIFNFFYDYKNHYGYLEDKRSNIKYNLSSDNLKIPELMLNYLEKSSLLLLLMLKGNNIPNIKNGDYEIKDILFLIKDYKIEKALLESANIPLKVYYKNYKKWENIYYPSTINIIFQDYDISILITEANFYLSF